MERAILTHRDIDVLPSRTWCDGPAVDGGVYSEFQDGFRAIFSLFGGKVSYSGHSRGTRRNAVRSLELEWIFPILDFGFWILDSIENPKSKMDRVSVRVGISYADRQRAFRFRAAKE